MLISSDLPIKRMKIFDKIRSFNFAGLEGPSHPAHTDNSSKNLISDSPTTQHRLRSLISKHFHSIFVSFALIKLPLNALISQHAEIKPSSSEICENLCDIRTFQR